MRRRHNKKRNTGLLYEFLVRHISRSLVEGKQRKSSSALKIIKKYFKPGTQLYNEFRLINSLMRTTVSSTPTAASIVKEAKKAALDYDAKALDREKSLLIRSINHSINESSIYDQPIDNYKMYATIQMLLNEWREGDSLDFARRGQYEDQLIEWLLSEKASPSDANLGDEDAGTNKLLMGIIMKKLNEKYNHSLSPEQKDVIRSYVWSTSSDDPDKIKNKLTSVRTNLIESIDSYVSEAKGDEYLAERLDQTKAKLLSEDVSSVDDSMITRFMLYMNLNSELSGEGDGDDK